MDLNGLGIKCAIFFKNRIVVNPQARQEMEESLINKVVK